MVDEPKIYVVTMVNTQSGESDDYTFDDRDELELFLHDVPKPLSLQSVWETRLHNYSIAMDLAAALAEDEAASLSSEPHHG